MMAFDFDTKLRGIDASFEDCLKSGFSRATNLERNPLSLRDSLSLRAAKPAPPVCPVEICKTDGIDSLITSPPIALF